MVGKTGVHLRYLHAKPGGANVHKFQMSTNANINENGKATAVLIGVCGQWWQWKFVDNGRPGCMGFGRNVPVQKVEMRPKNGRGGNGACIGRGDGAG